jgi:hypothetical protein
MMSGFAETECDFKEVRHMANGHDSDEEIMKLADRFLSILDEAINSKKC